MKLIIAGSRTLTDPRLLDHAMAQSGVLVWTGEDQITEVVSGGAAGIDALGEMWAKVNEDKVKLTIMPVTRRSVQLFGKIAYRARNQRMAEYGDVLLAIWDGESPGTRHMISCMEQRGKPVFKSVVQKMSSGN